MKFSSFIIIIKHLICLSTLFCGSQSESYSSGNFVSDISGSSNASITNYNDNTYEQSGENLSGTQISIVNGKFSSLEIF